MSRFHTHITFSRLVSKGNISMSIMKNNQIAKRVDPRAVLGPIAATVGLLDGVQGTVGREGYGNGIWWRGYGSDGMIEGGYGSNGMIEGGSDGTVVVCFKRIHI